MKTDRFVSISIVIGVMALLAGCGPGQFLGPTVTPTSTHTPIPTATNTPQPTHTPIPTPFGGGAVIAFSSNRDGNWEIYTMDSDGTNQSRLTTSLNTSDWFPKFSPDGQILLYWSYTENPFSAKLHWMAPDGSGGEFANGVLGYTSFSPDNETVALSIFTGTDNVDIFTGSAEGGDLIQVSTDPGWDYEPAWSPDGKTIAFVSKRDHGNPYIYLMNTDGSDLRRLTKSSGVAELEPSWSPDGRTIAFVSGSLLAFLPGGPHLDNIYLINPDGTDLRNLTDQTDSYNENPVWSPDGSMLAFWSDRSGSHQIYAISLDGSELIQLTDNASDNENPTWSIGEAVK